MPYPLPGDYFGGLDPVWVPDGAQTDGPVVDVPVTKLYADSLYGKLRGVRLEQGSPARLRLGLFSPATGGPLAVTTGQYSEAPTVLVRYREATGVLAAVYEPDDPDVAALAADGRSVLLPVPAEVKDHPGVYRAQAMVRDGGGVERVRDECVVLVERGMWMSDGTSPGNDQGPPLVSELRTLMRDHPGANRLLGDTFVDLGEIGQSITNAVTTFNTEFPPNPRLFTTVNFPRQWRRQWMDGTLAYLYETFAEYCRRGQLMYTAGGLAVDDLNKEKDYTRAAATHRDRFLRWCRTIRTQMSISSAWGSTGSGLGRGFSTW